MKNIRLLILIMMYWFVIASITNILGPLIPDIMSGFNLSNLALAGFIPTFFFISYAIMSIPSGILIDRFGEKPVLLAGFIMPLCGTLIFACFPSYPVLLLSCFIVGLGMAMLQTVLNPLQRVAGGEENYAVVAQCAQFMFGIASFSSPFVYSYLVSRLNPSTYVAGESFPIDMLAKVTPSELPWVSLYWIFSFLLLFMLISVVVTRIPRIDPESSESASRRSTYKELFGKKIVWLYFLGIFSYVCLEQGISIFMSTFFEQYHGLNPQTEGASLVGYFWGLMTVGCIIGIILLRLFDSRHVLIGSGIATSILLVLALTGPTHLSVITFPLIGLSISMMFSIIFSLALNSVSNHHGSFAGILCSAIAGGAVGPLLLSWISDMYGLRNGMFILFVFILYILSIGIWARPLINNKTVSFRLRKKRN